MRKNCRERGHDRVICSYSLYSGEESCEYIRSFGQLMSLKRSSAFLRALATACEGFWRYSSMKLLHIIVGLLSSCGAAYQIANQTVRNMNIFFADVSTTLDMTSGIRSTRQVEYGRHDSGEIRHRIIAGTGICPRYYLSGQ